MLAILPILVSVSGVRPLEMRLPFTGSGFSVSFSFGQFVVVFFFAPGARSVNPIVPESMVWPIPFSGVYSSTI